MNSERRRDYSHELDYLQKILDVETPIPPRPRAWILLSAALATLLQGISDPYFSRRIREVFAHPQISPEDLICRIAREGSYPHLDDTPQDRTVRQTIRHFLRAF